MKSKEKNTNYKAEITEEDKHILGDKLEHIRTDGGGDNQLADREKPVDFAGKDLDIPGRNLPNQTKESLKDEENQLYSQGGDSKRNLE